MHWSRLYLPISGISVAPAHNSGSLAQVSNAGSRCCEPRGNQYKPEHPGYFRQQYGTTSVYIDPQRGVTLSTVQMCAGSESGANIVYAVAVCTSVFGLPPPICVDAVGVFGGGGWHFWHTW
jgi:hypothetical protein